jgi:hypothetical protein
MSKLRTALGYAAIAVMSVTPMVAVLLGYRLPL